MMNFQRTLSMITFLSSIMIASSSFAIPAFKTAGKCEPKIVAVNKKCVVVTTIDEDGNFNICYCDRNGNQNKRNIPFPDPVVVDNHDVKYTKIKPADDSNPDPCVTIVQGNQYYQICW